MVFDESLVVWVGKADLARLVCVACRFRQNSRNARAILQRREDGNGRGSGWCRRSWKNIWSDSWTASLRRTSPKRSWKTPKVEELSKRPGDYDFLVLKGRASEKTHREKLPRRYQTLRGNGMLKSFVWRNEIFFGISIFRPPGSSFPSRFRAPSLSEGHFCSIFVWSTNFLGILNGLASLKSIGLSSSKSIGFFFLLLGYKCRFIILPLKGVRLLLSFY